MNISVRASGEVGGEGGRGSSEERSRRRVVGRDERLEIFFKKEWGRVVCAKSKEETQSDRNDANRQLS